jgi:glycosyltransferase involved in cell wall biosynthesis
MHQRDASRGIPLVSVVIPAYQAAGFIKETLDSVFAQTFQDFEVIVVNDGSPDTEELEKILEPYQDRIVYLKQENQGPAGARNAGVRASRGEFIAPLDADDLWMPEYMAEQLKALNADPSIDMIYADALIFGNVPEAGRSLMELSPSEGEITFGALVTRKCSVNVCVCLIRREIVFRTGLFDPAFRGTEDIDLWLRILMHGGRIGHQRKVLGQYRRRQDSLSANHIAMVESYIKTLSKISQDPLLSPSQREIVNRQILCEGIRLEAEKGKYAFLRGDYPAAIGHLERVNAQQRSVKTIFTLLLLRAAPGLAKTLYDWRHRNTYSLKPQS